MVPGLLGTPPGAVRSSRGGQHDGSSMHSKIRKRDGPELLQAQTQMPHDSGIDLVHEIVLGDSRPASLRTGPESANDGAISLTQASQVKEEVDDNVGRTHPFASENAPSAYDKDFPSPIPPELLSSPFRRFTHVTSPEVNSDVLEIPTIPEYLYGPSNTTEREKTGLEIPTELPKPGEAISETTFHDIEPDTRIRHTLEVLIALDDGSSNTELKETNLPSTMNSPSSPRGAVGEIASHHLPPRPPPLPSSSTSDSPSSIDNTVDLFVPPGLRKAQEPYQNDWGKIKRLRADVRRLRSQSRQMKKVLRKKQQARSKADDKYFQYVRMRKFYPASDIDKKTGQDPEFERLYRDCEHLRDECGPLEDDCIQLDNDLSYHEFELEKLEDKLYERPLELPASSATVKKDSVKGGTESPASSTYGGSEIGREYHPLVYQYLSKIGDVNNLNERLDWHEDEKANLEEEKERRMRFGLVLAEEEQRWLENYANLESDLISQIEKAEVEAEALRKKCFAQGLVDEEGEPTNFETRERQTFINDKALDTGSTRSEFVNFPALLPQPSGKQEQFQDPGLDPDEPTVDPCDRINGWLLHQLRMSALEVNRLAITYKSRYGDIEEGETWEIMVLEWWYKDGAKEGDGQSGRTIKSVSSGEETEKSGNANDKA